MGGHPCHDKLHFVETESVLAEQPDEQNVGRWQGYLTCPAAGLPTETSLMVDSCYVLGLRRQISCGPFLLGD